MAAKTSITHPLQIAELPIGAGSIGVTFCPGKRQPGGMTGPWDRDLALDLDAIEAWGAEAVVTLMEQHELAAVRVAGLGEAVEVRGLEWHHLPIVDVDVPDQRFEAGWLYTGLRLRHRLRAGGRVLVHCRGGLGRAGTIAARLLAELGQSPAAAVAAVRQVRRGAIETPAQERHALAAMPRADDAPFVDRLLGCLLGGAVGDGFGYAVEFMSLAAIRQKFGPDGLREPVHQGGRLVVSDDTQMTLFTLEGMLRALGPDGTCDADRLTEEVRLAYLDWLDTQGGGPGRALAGDLARAKALRVPRAPGNTCLSALRAGGRGSVERPINDSKGCGAVMRVAPLGLLPLTPAVAFVLAARAGALTHGHVDGWSSGALLAAIVVELMSGHELPAAAARAIEAGDATGSIKGPWRTRELASKACELAQAEGLPPEQVFRALGQGWTGEEALAIGLWAALGASDLHDAIRRGANHDGDSDSTASIAGQLYGAWRGVHAVPHRLVRRLDVLEELLTLAQRAGWIPTLAVAP